MLIYNVTVQLDQEIVEDWLVWMKATHIPDVMNTGMFVSYQLLRLMDENPDVTTYAVQYHCLGMDQLREYQSTFAPALQADHKSRYEGRFVAFRTLLERVDSSF